MVVTVNPDKTFNYAAPTGFTPNLPISPSAPTRASDEAVLAATGASGDLVHA